MSEQEKERIVDAVLYALRCGCLFPVPAPKPRASTQELIRWGAMRNLHAAVADTTRQNSEVR